MKPYVHNLQVEQSGACLEELTFKTTYRSEVVEEVHDAVHSDHGQALQVLRPVAERRPGRALGTDASPKRTIPLEGADEGTGKRSCLAIVPAAPSCKREGLGDFGACAH